MRRMIPMFLLLVCSLVSCPIPITMPYRAYLLPTSDANTKLGFAPSGELVDKSKWSTMSMNFWFKATSKT
jgi:hypothetical protein